MKNHPLLRRILNLAARILLGAVFLMTAAGHLVPDFTRVSEQMEARDVPTPSVLLVAGIVALLAGSLSIIIGFYARIGAALLLVFLVVSAVVMHTFWRLDGDVRENEMIHFLKNLALMGAMLFVIVHGSGPLSIDAWRARPARTAQPARPPRV